MLGFHEHKLDFAIIDEYDLYNIMVQDKSLYFESPDLPVLEVQKPNFKEWIRLPFTPDRANVLNSLLLGSTDLCKIPDGVYSFKLAVNPHNELFECKSYLRHANLYCQFQQLILNYDHSDVVASEKLKKKVIDIFMLIEAAKANASQGNKALANEQYKLALKMVEKETKTC